MKTNGEVGEVQLVGVQGGRVLTVVATLDGRYAGVGHAIREPTDSEDKITAKLLATGRALDDLAHALKREGWQRVQRT